MWSSASMTCWRNRPGLTVLVLGSLGLAYPFAVFALLGRVPAGFMVGIALALAAARLMSVRQAAAARALLPALSLVLAVTAGLAAVNARTAMLAYPVVMSLAMAAAFGLSWIFPPSLVESLAALGRTIPSPAAHRYMARLSLVWCGFLCGNAALSAATLWSGDMALWTLYNGLISYLLMGILAGGEYLVRRRLQAREEQA